MLITQMVTPWSLYLVFLIRATISPIFSSLFRLSTFPVFPPAKTCARRYGVSFRSRGTRCLWYGNWRPGGIVALDYPLDMSSRTRTLSRVRPPAGSHRYPSLPCLFPYITVLQCRAAAASAMAEVQGATNKLVWQLLPPESPLHIAATWGIYALPGTFQINTIYLRRG